MISLAASPVAAPQAEQASSPAGTGSRLAGQVQAAGQPGAVSATEMMAAVRDMLAAAEVPLDLERSELLQQTLELRAQLQGTQSRLTTAQQVGCLVCWLPHCCVSLADLAEGLCPGRLREVQHQSCKMWATCRPPLPKQACKQGQLIACIMPLQSGACSLLSLQCLVTAAGL